MDPFRELLLDIWREACRHIEISRSTAAVAGFLAPHIPIERILVRRIDPQRNCLETVAVGPLAAGQEIRDARSECRPGQMEATLCWCRAGDVFHGSSSGPDGRGEADSLPAAILPEPVRCDVLAGPLALRDDRFGVLLLLARPPERFRAAAC